MTTTVPRLFAKTARTYSDKPALCYKKDGQWRSLTWKDYYDASIAVARGLASTGLEQGGYTAIISNNRPEWLVANNASILAGATPAGIYATNSPDQMAYIVSHCEASVLFIEDQGQLAKVVEARAKMPSLQTVVVLDDSQPAQEISGLKVYTWTELAAKAADFSRADLQARMDSAKVDDVAALVYTSGTTANPKAVMLTHENVTWMSENCVKRDLNLSADDILISYLPLSHVAEQMTTIHGPMYAGSTVYFAECLDKLGENLKEVRPTLFLGVPRVWEKIQAKMGQKAQAASPLKRKIAAWAKAVGLAEAEDVIHGKEPSWKFKVAKKLVFDKVREALGLDRCRLQVTAAAPISKDTLNYFLSLNIPLYEIFGMSECTGPATISQPGEYKCGRAGRVISGGQVRIADDGEILIKGRHVFKGYLHNEEATREAIDEDGWLHTGDLGDLDEDGYLAITGRKKNLIITAGGENIAPEMIENKLKALSFVEQAVVVGDRRKYLTTLLTLDWEAAKGELTRAQSQAKSLEEACRCQRFNAYVEEQLSTVNKSIARVQTIKKFSLLPYTFSEEGGDLTPTMKVKRAKVIQKFAQEIEVMYS